MYKIEDFMYAPSDTERFLSPGFPEAGRGFHTLYERMDFLPDGHRIVVGYLIGGANNGARATIVLAQDKGGGITVGFHAGGFRLPVPYGTAPDITVLQKAVRRLPPTGNLAWVDCIPGFIVRREGDEHTYHRDGWYTRSILAVPLLPDEIPAIFRFEDGVQAWKIREGIYFSFANGTYRLVPYEEFFPKDQNGYPVTPWWKNISSETEVARQGDCMVISESESEFPIQGHSENSVSWEEISPSEVGLLRLGRHEIIVSNTAPARFSPMLGQWMIEGEFKLIHPEHTPLQIFGAGVHRVAILPGTSRPFRKGGDGDKD